MTATRASSLICCVPTREARSWGVMNWTGIKTCSPTVAIDGHQSMSKKPEVYVSSYLLTFMTRDDWSTV